MTDAEHLELLARIEAGEILLAFLLDIHLGSDMDARRRADFAPGLARAMASAKGQDPNWSDEKLERFGQLLTEHVERIYGLANRGQPGRHPPQI